MSRQGGIKGWKGLLSACALLLGTLVPCQAGTVVVATSYPKDFTNAYKQAFERRHPQIQVEFVSVPGSQILPFLNNRGPGARPDLYWASAPDSFEILAEAGLLENSASPSTGRPGRPQALFHVQALSGFGIMANQRYLQAHELPPPTDWIDLTRAEYFGHLAMSTPSRSGTVHWMVEFMLQRHGWDQGWSLLQQIAGNASTITDRSVNVVDGVNVGRYGIGLTIDFPALTSIQAGFPVSFAYPHAVPLFPANIGLIKGSAHRNDALKFIDFTLSRDGQQLLLTPGISRLPAQETAYQAEKLNPWLATLRLKTRQQPTTYDLGLSRSRYTLVSAYFDQVITLRQRELNAATRAIHTAEALNRSAPRADASALIESARRLAYQPLLSLADLESPALRRRLSAAELPFLEAEWSQAAKSRYNQARREAEKAITLLRRASRGL